MELSLFSPSGNDTRQLLDWNLIISSLCHHAHFEVNQQALFNSFLSFEASKQSIDLIHQLINFPVATITTLKNSFCNIDSSHSASERFLLLQKYSVPNVSTLNFCANIILTHSNASRVLSEHTLFKRHEPNIKVLLKIVQEIRNFIEPNGSINFDKHPLLRSQNEKITALSRQIRDRIQALIKDVLYCDSLAYDQYDIFEDRFVLPIRADHYRYEHGIIVSRSQSGQTLLVEPLELRELANRRLRELSLLDEILNKLCIEIGKSISNNFHDCELVLKTLHELDLIICKTLFSVDKNLQKPEFNSRNEFIVEDFFHPLIDNPIKNSIHIDHKTKGMLISGPNTGGKTVTLKSLCLCFLFFRIGLYLPARRVSLPIFDDVYFFSHDQQSLEKGLSSFSSESERYLSIIEGLSNHSYIFIDEIFNSTSSEEASALALGFISYITSCTQSKLFISSHHHRLKAIIHQREDFISAHVGFDPSTESPTYKLHMGSPGPSMAITIFKNFSRKFSHSTSIANMAETYLESNYINYEQLLEQLNSQKEVLGSQNKYLNQLIKEATQAKSAADGVLHLEKQRILSDFETDLSRKIAIADDLIYRLKNNPASNQKTYFNELSQIKKLISKTSNHESVVSNSDPIDSAQVQIGHFYFHSELAQDIQVLELNSRKSKLLALAGNIKVWTEMDKLYPPRKPMTSKKSSQIGTILFESSSSSMNIDARGLRLDQFQTLTDKALSDLYRDELPYIEIIHGHGDGILKRWLRDYLKSQSDLEWSTPEGNDGSTIIKIR